MPGGKPLQGMRILLVEDNPTNQQVACELLQIQGATVQLASDGRQGVRALQQAGAQGFDVVLMDLQMPEMDGFAATREIRATPGLQSLPIIAMTANAMDSDRDACLQAGMQAHIGKPFELQRLIQVLCSQTGWSAAAQPADVTVACSKALRHAADTAGADLQAALRRLGGDLALYTLTVAGLQTELRAFAAQLTLPEQACRQPELARQLHTIKGLAASAGLARLAEAARRTEAQVVQVANSQGCRTALGPMQRAIGDQLPKLEALHRVLMAEAAEDAAKVPAKRRSARHDDCLVALLGLKEQLILKNYDALGAVAIIQQDFGEVLGDDLDPLLEAMAELAFEAALQACQTLIDHMKP
jgi:CheY-like chemotaxis protein